MIALDTNVLVRLFVDDSPEQTEKARELIQAADSRGEHTFVPFCVVLETIWVLKSNYRCSRSEIAAAIDQLLQIQVLEFEHRERVENAVRLARESHKPGIGDLLIGLSAAEAGCTTTYTFDKAASKNSLFTLIG